MMRGSWETGDLFQKPKRPRVIFVFASCSESDQRCYLVLYYQSLFAILHYTTLGRKDWYSTASPCGLIFVGTVRGCNTLYRVSHRSPAKMPNGRSNNQQCLLSIGVILHVSDISNPALESAQHFPSLPTLSAHYQRGHYAGLSPISDQSNSCSSCSCGSPSDRDSSCSSCSPSALCCSQYK